MPKQHKCDDPHHRARREHRDNLLRACTHAYGHRSPSTGGVTEAASAGRSSLGAEALDVGAAGESWQGRPEIEEESRTLALEDFDIGQLEER